MRLYLVRGDPAFSMLRPVHESEWQSRGGVPVSEPWDDVEFIQLDSATAEFMPVDCLTMNTGADGFLVSAFARDILGSLLIGDWEFWPTRVLGHPYWWLNCMAVVEALDREKTEADWSVVEGEWGSFSWITTTRRLAFRPGRVRHAPMLFRVPEYPQGVLFASEELRSVVEEHGLTGFKFDLVWSSDSGGVSDPPGVGLGDVLEPRSAEELNERRLLARDMLARREEVRK